MFVFFSEMWSLHKLFPKNCLFSCIKSCFTVFYDTVIYVKYFLAYFQIVLLKKLIVKIVKSFYEKCVPGYCAFLWICHLLLESFICQGCLIQHRETECVHISVRVIMATDLCICSAYFVNPGFFACR